MKQAKKMKTHTLSEIEDKIIGPKGTPERDQYEYELKMDILGEFISQIRKERNMTQEQLGKLIGVQKSTVSKLEKNGKNMTIDTILKVFNALKTKVKLKIELGRNRELEIA